MTDFLKGRRIEKIADYTTYGLLGENVSKSLSPQIYNALFEELQIPAVYMPFPVAKADFLPALPVLRAVFSGFNVTAPFRQDIMAHLDQLDESAKAVGTANTIKVQDEKMIGYNTEKGGFEHSLSDFSVNLYDKDVLLVGSEGVAYTIANVLLEQGAFITILSRTLSHAQKLKESLQKKYNKNRVKVVKGLAQTDDFYAIVNSAAVDLESKQSEVYIHPQVYQGFRYAFDVSYRQSAFLKKAASFGAKTKNGFDMLFFQAVRSLEIWLDHPSGFDASAIAKTYGQIRDRLAQQPEKKTVLL